MHVYTHPIGDEILGRQVCKPNISEGARGVVADEVRAAAALGFSPDIDIDIDR